MSRRRPSPFRILVIGAIFGVLAVVLPQEIRRALHEPPAEEEERAPAYDTAFDPNERVSGAYTSYHRINYRRIVAPEDPGSGGAIALIGEQPYLVTRRGVFHRVDREAAEVLPLGIAAPVNTEADEAYFARAKDNLATGIKDMALREVDGGIEILLSHVHVDHAEDCIGLAVSRAVVARDALEAGAPANPDWEQLFESTPCLDRRVGTLPLQSGGTLLHEPGGGILVFVGEFGFDRHGRSRADVDSQLDGISYGRIMRLPAGSGPAVEVTRGHRNPGGLAFLPDGRLMMAEMGPQGGDELNLILEGQNYGWPLRSYGVHYGTHVWPPSEITGSHEGFAQPIYSWVPSIAPMGLGLMTGEEFPSWEGDLILGTLKDRALHRLRLHEGRLISAERIPLGERVRDLAISPAGVIWIKADILPLVIEGRRLDATDHPLAMCTSCHGVEEGMADGTAPSLVGVFGREIASIEGYAYSDGLSAVGGRWTEDRLTAYLRNGAAFAPGTNMPQQDLSEAEITRIVAAMANVAE